MSYVLINGKRYYKDDRTGRTMLDNVSQEEADRRAQIDQAIANPMNTTSTVSATVHTGFSWKAVIASAVIVSFIGAFIYNCSHVSLEEQAITNYMKAQQAQEVSDMVENRETDTVVAEAAVLKERSVSVAYLMQESAERCLEASDIENYSHDEIQLIINGIYARHGREFHTQENINYFSEQDWYDPISGKTDEEIVREFNEFERTNVKLLCEYL
ncbi:MAG: YARHG domain-containing protein [Clostridiales bacterium]|nr:YARHG domain-containing protein [Clostridiales bacterium]